MIAWVRAGSALAERFPGFLGTGWVRPSADSDEWHMLYRFDSAASLARGRPPPQRRLVAGLGAGPGRGVAAERRTGIEGWFDAPARARRRGPPAAPPAPPRWKQAVMIWTAFFPLSLLAGLAARPVARAWPLVPRVLVTTVVMTPIMTYLVLPQLTRRLDWWLQGDRPPGGLTGSVGRR